MDRRRGLIFPNDKRPKTNGVVDGVIQDSIEQVVINCKAGKVSEFYSIGDHVAINLDGIGTCYFDYIGSGKDERTDGADKPVSTWLSRDVIDRCVWNQNQTTEGGWDASYIRNYCRTTIYNALPSIIRNNIVTVNKYTNVNPMDGSFSGPKTEDTVWIPSDPEVTSYRGGYYERFDLDDTRVKMLTGGVAFMWWTRTTYGSYQANYIDNDGSSDSSTHTGAHVSNGLVPGFCL